MSCPTFHLYVLLSVLYLHLRNYWFLITFSKFSLSLTAHWETGIRLTFWGVGYYIWACKVYETSVMSPLHSTSDYLTKTANSAHSRTPLVSAGKCHGKIYIQQTSTDMLRLTTGIRSEKCAVRRFRRCANVFLHKPRQYTTAYYTPRLYGIAYCY